jgi:predicted kinase
MIGAVLYIFAGLPGSGKSTMAKRLAQHTGAVYLRIDTIEQALRDLCSVDVGGEGYRLAYRVAADNLGIGRSVVADSCNPIDLTRTEWQGVATDVGAAHTNVEVICSDADEHRLRVARRVAEVEGLVLPTWQEVTTREYHAWSSPRLILDTAGKSETQSIGELLMLVGLSPLESQSDA